MLHQILTVALTIVVGVTVAVAAAAFVAFVYKTMGAEGRRLFLVGAMAEFTRGHSYNDRRSW